MSNKIQLAFATILLLSVLSLSACRDEPSTSSTCTSNLDRQALVNFYAVQIDDRLTALQSAADALEASAQAFRSPVSAENLQVLREALKSLRIEYHRYLPYSLIVDESQARAQALQSFPVDTNLINGYASQGNFSATKLPDFDRGFAAVEYLLYGKDSTQTLAQLQGQAGRSQLLSAYIRDIQSQLAAMNADWQSTGRQSFTSATGTDAGSGLSALINSFSKSVEDLRRDQVANPYGATLGFPNPDVAESPYGGQSLQLLSTSAAAFSTAFSGESSTTPSLASYLRGISTSDGAALAEDIATQHAKISEQLATIGLNQQFALETAVVNDREAVRDLLAAYSRQVVYLKTDLPAVACVSITYVDNPSDSD